MMSRFLLTILLILVGSPAWALTTYYVDPDGGGSQTGAAATPWTSLAVSGAWTTINTTLASDDVTVYFSARNAGSDTNQASTTQLEIRRTDTSTHRLTLDGIGQYNTNDASPSWAPYVTPSPTNYKTASKFQITTTSPIQSSGLASNTNCLNYITIQGFRLIYTGSGGQIANLSYIGNLIFQYSEGSTAPGASGGPGVLVGPVHGPTCAVDHVQVRSNYIHDSYGECIYVGSPSPTGDPPGNPGATPSGDDYLIQDNTITNCGRQGGQGDGIDVKDGHTNLRLVKNVITYSNLVVSDCSGIIVEGADLIDGNYVETPQKNGIYGGASWNNTVGRSSGLIVRNNIVVNTTIGPGHQNAFEWEGASSATYQWSGVKFYNNSIYSTGDACITLGAPQGTATVENNLMQACGTNGVQAEAGILGTHDYNHYFNIISGSAVVNGATSTSCDSIATVEPHSVCADPKFVNTSAPYTATNFQLQAGSPAIGSGLDLSGTFTDDYTRLSRVVPWEKGAFNTLTTVASSPAGPTGLVVH